MKTVKVLFFSMLVALVTFTSCTNNDSDIDNLPDPQESASMQTTIIELRTMFNEDGSMIEEENPTGNLIFDLCFEFVYPIELIYNTGTTVTVNSNEELITIIVNSTNELFIVGIEFPFDVEIYNPNSNEVEIITINNETEFAELIENCDFNDPCDCDTEYDPVCVEIEVNGTTTTITFPNACLAECEGFTEDDFFECDGGCDCPSNYDPVCVEVEVNGELQIIEFQNYCYAECEGYTQQDMVDCNIDDECEISDLEVTVGECNADGTYQITIDFEYEETDQEYFDLYIRNGVLLGYYALADLPLTIESFQLSGYDEDYIKVCINDNADCCAETEWFPPNCDGDDCTITNLEVEVGECNPSGTYSLTIDFEYENVNGQQYFDLFVRNNEFIGYYSLSDLPLTIPNFELSGYDEDYIKVCINDTEGCCQEIEWEAPDCDGNGGDDCFEFVFPINMYNAGGSVEVNSNEEYEEFLDEGYNLLYPVTIIVDNETIIINQGIEDGFYGELCD